MCDNATNDSIRLKFNPTMKWRMNGKRINFMCTTETSHSIFVVVDVKCMQPSEKYVCLFYSTIPLHRNIFQSSVRQKSASHFSEIMIMSHRSAQLDKTIYSHTLDSAPFVNVDTKESKGRSYGCSLLFQTASNDRRTAH